MSEVASIHGSHEMITGFQTQPLDAGGKCESLLKWCKYGTDE